MAAANADSQLKIGAAIRYRGLGAGRVVRHITRPFQGQEREFAVVEFVHRDLEAQVPIGDELVAEKIDPVLSRKQIDALIAGMASSARVLPRSWDQREEIGHDALKRGGPEEWAALLASYAVADGAGVTVAASDDELLRSAEELLAAELACAAKQSYEWALEVIRGAYERIAASSSKGKKSASAEHFAAVQV